MVRMCLVLQFFSEAKRITMLGNFLREYDINRILLSRIGYWPYQNKCVRNALRIFFLLMSLSYFPFEILILHDHWDDAQMIFEGSYQIVLSFCVFVRLLHVFFNHDKLKRLYELIDEHWNIFTNDIEVQVLKDYSLTSRKFTMYYSCLYYAITLGFIIIPLTPTFLDIVLPLNESRPRMLLVEVEFRVDKDEYFVPIFCYMITVIVIGISILVGIDTVQIMCTTHACSLFSAISKQIENIISKVNNKNEINVDCEQIIYKEYVICLKKHQLAIEFVSMLNSANQMISLSLLALVIAVISLVGIRVVYALGEMQEMARYTFIIVAALMVLIILCYPGQKLMDESQNIFHQAYATEWYCVSSRIKSLLIIMFYRSTVPCGLMAGNIIPLSMETCGAVIRMSVSYFTAFLSFKKDD